MKILGYRYFILDELSSKPAAILAKPGNFTQIEPKWTPWTSAI